MMRALVLALAASAWLLSLGTQAPVVAQTPAAAHQAPSFQTSDNCLACHNGLRAASGEDVSLGVSWRASMMANSARDPYWQAAVRRETIDHPTKKAVIEDECAICHMPMARTAARAAGRHGEVFALLPTTGTLTDDQRLAADGVSCSLCHQIGADRLGTPESFVGGFSLQAPAAEGPRMLGPYDIDAARAAIMRSATGAVPAKAEHLRQSEMCATCHTLITEAYTPDGRVAGSLPEQVPYLEWRHSAFATERSCQNCHMPRVENAPIASVLGETREWLGRHTFIGGNAFMLRMLNRFRAELAVTAPAPELEAAAAATVRQLQTDTVSVAIPRAVVRESQLEADVRVRNLTGHKLPTGYPSRRVWLHVTVRDGAGSVVFETGAVEANGRIRGNDNDDDPSRLEPHYEEIRTPEQVQIYEAIMATPDGRVTTGLLQATQYLKDNRLLPRGFVKSTAGADIAVHGDARNDADFTESGDDVRLLVGLGRAQGPFTVDAEVRYQTIGYRWAENLRGYDAAEPRRFVSFFDSMASSSATTLARAAAVVP